MEYNSFIKEYISKTIKLFVSKIYLKKSFFSIFKKYSLCYSTLRWLIYCVNITETKISK